MKTLTINGKVVQLKRLRNSKKGVTVDGTRLHIAGLGTVYIQAYDTEKELIAATPSFTEASQPRQARGPSPIPPPPVIKAEDNRGLMERIIRVMTATNEQVNQISERLTMLEDAATRPSRPSAPRPPPPGNGGH